MFAREAKVLYNIPGSPSLLPNNLSISKHKYTTFIKLNDVYVVRNDGESRRLPLTRVKVYQSKFLNIFGSIVLVVLCHNIVQIWSPDAETLYFQFPFSPIQDRDSYESGIATDGKHLFVSAANGHILVFDCSSGFNSGSNFPLNHNLETDPKHTLISLSSSSTILAAGNGFGNIYLFNNNEAFEQVKIFHGQGFPCNTMVQTENILIAGFATGHIRYYRTDILELFVEITAHIRPVMALALSDSTEYVASCSTDQFVHVWSVPNLQSKATTVNNLFSEQLEFKLSTGVAFLDDTKLVVANYDDEDLSFFTLVS